MTNMEKITKFIQAFKTHFNRNRTRKGDEDEGQEEPKEAAAAEDNQSPGDVRMNSGVHKKVYGVRRKILGFTVVGLLLAFSLSYLFFQGDSSKTPRRPSGSSAQESKMPSHVGEDATKDELSYRDLRALDQRGQAARNVPGQPPHTGDPTTVGGANGVSRTPAAAGALCHADALRSIAVHRCGQQRGRHRIRQPCGIFGRGSRSGRAAKTLCLCNRLCSGTEHCRSRRSRRRSGDTADSGRRTGTAGVQHLADGKSLDGVGKPLYTTGGDTDPCDALYGNRHIRSGAGHGADQH